MHRRFLIFLAAMAVFMPLLLAADRSGFGAQLALGGATVLFLWASTRNSPVSGAQIVCAIGVATLGEIVLSLGWGLYSYSHALIPFYVPPGHGLFFAIAAETAHQPALRVREKAITRGVFFAGTLYAVGSLVFLGDTWGFLWWLGALALIGFSRNQLMLSACFVYTIVLEWTGTAIGNWVWAAEVPGLGLHSANPPSGVGILYILLDLIVVGLTGTVLTRRSRPAEPMVLEPALTADN